jgi:hypothetical protein
MDEVKYKKIKAAFEKNGGEMSSSPELDKYLDFRGADAITLNDKLIIFRYGSLPTTSEVFEELIHTAQFKNGRISSALTIQNEIEAKEKLIKYQKQYGIPNHENQQTKMQLDELYKERQG